MAAERTPSAIKCIQGLPHDAEWAAGILRDIVAKNNAQVQENYMQPGMIDSTHGFAFMRARKGGLGVTMSYGEGFVVKKIHKVVNGQVTYTWSPPFFFSISGLGAGLAAGFEVCDSVLALINNYTVELFKEPHTRFGTDLVIFSTTDAMRGTSAGVLGTRHQMDVKADDKCVCFAYHISSGALWDISLNGTKVSPHTKKNAELYGPEATFEDILGGQVANTYLEEFKPLYRALKELRAHPE